MLSGASIPILSQLFLMLLEKEGLDPKEKCPRDEVSMTKWHAGCDYIKSGKFEVEGASKEGNRGPSIWDAYSHTEGKICDGSNGDVAVDQYNRYKEDIELISMLGFQAYRFSISWSRIFPAVGPCLCCVGI